MTDWVAISSYLSVAIAAVILIVLVLKVRNLMYKDQDKD